MQAKENNKEDATSIFLYGPEAFHYIATHVEGKGLIGFASHLLFRYHPIANIAYPIFVCCRRLLLKLLGRPLINGSNPLPQKGESNDKP